MDFLRPRAIPALTLLLWAAPAAACSLDGTWRIDPSARAADSMSALVYVIPREQLVLLRNKDATAAQSSGGYTRAVYRAAAMEITGGASPRLRFLDDKAQPITTTALEGRWSCRDGRLVRSAERYAGTGDAVHLQRQEDALYVERGELVLLETLSNLDKPSEPPRRKQVRFKALPR